MLFSSRRPGSPDLFLAKVGADATVRWAKPSPLDLSYYSSVGGVDNANNYYLAGSFYGDTSFEGTTFTSFGSSTLLTKLDPNGQILWNKQIAGYNSDVIPAALARDTAGNMYLTGNFRNRAVFGAMEVTPTNSSSVYLVKVTGATAPIITQEPQSRTVHLGEAVSFSVSATGTEPLSYQWNKNGQAILGATDPNFSISSASAQDAASYTVTVKNAGGISVSASATLQVIVPEAGTVAFGEASYTIEETNGFLTVTVVRSGNTSISAIVSVVTTAGTALGGEDFWLSDIVVEFAPGESVKTVLIPIADDNAWEPTEAFTLRFSNPGPGVAIGSQDFAVVNITDTDVPGGPVIEIQPVSRTVTVSNSVSFSVLANGAPPLSYQWRKNGDDIPNATNRYLVFASAQFTDAGAYSVLVRNDQGEASSLDAMLTVLPPPDIYYVMFGLTNRPWGATRINTNSGYLEVTRRYTGDDDEDMPGNFGVSVTLGEADAGAFGHLWTSSSFQNYGNWTAGYVYGQKNGVPDQFLCSLKATTVDWSGRYEIVADFSPLAPSGVTYEIYKKGNLVASTRATRPLYLVDYNETSPSANPFWRLPDGTIAAVIQLSYERYLEIADEWCVSGDRIVIRAENTAASAEFASRIDIVGGGGEDLITINQERLGMFNHSHAALGDCVFKTVAGQLTLARISDDPSAEFGTAIELDQNRNFRVQLQPQDLGMDGSVVASASGTDQAGVPAKFLGLIGLRASGGVRQVTGELSEASQTMHVVVYRDGVPAATVLLSSNTAVLPVSGNPRVVHFEAGAENGLSHPWLAMQLDQQTTFTLPDGSTLLGDQVRFRAAEAVALYKLTTFNITAAHVPEFTILAESARETISLADYLPDVLMPVVLKHFGVQKNGTLGEMIRSSSRMNLEGRPVVELTDESGKGVFASSYYRVEPEGLRWHGASWDSQTLLSGSGLLVLPEIMALGQGYAGQGTMKWVDSISGQQQQLEVSWVTRVVAEHLNLNLGPTPALRVEMSFSFSGGTGDNAPVTWMCTNWLASGVGLVKFSETRLNSGGQIESCSGEITACAMLETTPRDFVANLGAGVTLSADVLLFGNGRMVDWQKNGGPIPEAMQSGGTYNVEAQATVYPQKLYLQNLQEIDAGSYSIVVGVFKSDGDTLVTRVGPAGGLRVVPFSDTPPFWVAQLGASSSITPVANAADSSGNSYLAGSYSGYLQAGTNTIYSRGQEDVFVAKIDGSGRVLWARNGGGANTDRPRSVRVDASGNVYVAGNFLGTATFGTNQLNSSVPVRIDPAFVGKLDPNGNWLWVVANGGTSANVACTSMDTDASGNVYIAGTFANGTVTFGTITLTNLYGNNSLFVAKLNPQGQWTWAQKISSSGNPSPNVVLANGSSGIFLAGSYFGNLTFDTCALPYSTPTRGFLAKANADGTWVWTQQVGSDVDFGALDMSGNLCLAGSFTPETSTIGSSHLSARNSYSDSYLAKVDTDGVVLWARLSPHYISGHSETPLTVDSANNIYVSSSISGEADYSMARFYAVNRSTVLSKLAPTGESIWDKQLTGSENWPGTLARDASGNVYLAGTYWSPLQVGESNIVSTTHANAYLVKITGATAPTITLQPQPQVVNLGGGALFTVSATGSEPLFYQWRKNGLELPGANEPTYCIPAAQWQDAGSYSVIVKNGGGVVTSDSVALQVIVPDGGTVAFTDSQYSVAENSSVVTVNLLRTGNTSSEATVELRTTDGTAEAGLDYLPATATVHFGPGQNSKVVTLRMVDNGEWEPTESYNVRLCSAGPGVTIGSPDAALVVITDDDLFGAPVIRTHPFSQTVSEGQPLYLYVVASSATPMAYEWRKDGVALAGQTNREIRIPAVTSVDAGSYSVLVRNAVSEEQSREAAIIVVPLPVILSPPQDQNVHIGDNATFTVVARGGTPALPKGMAPAMAQDSLTYRWLKDGVMIDGATAASLTIEPVNNWDAGQYTVIVNDANGGTISASAILEVSAPILRIQPDPNNPGYLQLWWSAQDYHLQVTDDPVRNVWQLMPDAFSGISVPAGNRLKFYRLIYD